jgi:hypothetical protein
MVPDRRWRVAVPIAGLLVSAAVLRLPLDSPVWPAQAPAGYDHKALLHDPVIRVNVAYDRHVAARHGAALEWVIVEALAIHTSEWRKYRRERFELASTTLIDSGTERDARHVLTRFVMRTIEAPRTIHVTLVGRSLEVHTGSRRTAVRGLALRGSDTLLITATRAVSARELAYYLFHEIGHLWEAHDLPFGGGNSTFGSKSAGYSFVVDAGNIEILQASSGPAPRKALNRAPNVIMAHVAVHRRPNARKRHQIASHYWRANDLIARKDYAAAEREIAAIRAIETGSTDVHLLVGAMEKKIRLRR